MEDKHSPSRRALLLTGGLSLAGLMLVREQGIAKEDLTPTPACHDGDEPTPAETEGPFFKPRSPQRGDLREPGIAGRPSSCLGSC